MMNSMQHWWLWSSWWLWWCGWRYSDHSGDGNDDNGGDYDNDIGGRDFYDDDVKCVALAGQYVSHWATLAPFNCSHLILQPLSWIIGYPDEALVTRVHCPVAGMVSTWSLFRGENQIKNEYWMTTMGGSVRNIKSRSFLGVGPGHLRVSTHHCRSYSLY